MDSPRNNVNRPILDNDAENGIQDDDQISSEQVDYRTWEGRQRFFCRGALMTGPRFNQGQVVFIHILIVLVICFWVTFIHPYFVYHLDMAGYSYTVIIFAILTQLLILITEFSDPGVLRKRRLTGQRLSVRDEKQAIPVVGMGSVNNAYGFLNSHIYRDRYCYSCKIIRPRLASHCPTCDSCVTRMDHHCTIVNNCIGQRNYRTFVMAVYVSFVFGLLALIGCSIYIYTAIKLVIAGSDELQSVNTTRLIIAGVILSISLPAYFFIDIEKKNEYMSIRAMAVVFLTQIVGFSILLTPFQSLDITTGDDDGEPVFFYGVSPVPGYLFMLASIWLAAIQKLVRRYWYLIQRGLTLKEKNSIEREDNDDFQNMNNRLSCGQRLRNIWYIFTVRVQPSIFDRN